MGPFPIVKQVGDIAYQLQILPRWSVIHPMFHVLLLHHGLGHLLEKPPPLLVDGSEEYEIQTILGHQDTQRGRRYRVRWRGYGPEEDTWLSHTDLTHAEDLLRRYQRDTGLEED